MVMILNYKLEVLNYCGKLGLDTVGFTECRVFNELKSYFQDRKERNLQNEFEEENIEKRVNPFLYLEDGKTIISIAFPYLFDDNFKDTISFSKYTRGKDYHLVVSDYLKRICQFIESLGGKAVYLVDSNALPERYIAALSGIGFIGKNNLLITEKYGSYVFLGEIITDLEIEYDKPSESKCGDCRLCQNGCPTGAIKTENNPNICLSYITQKKEIDDEWFSKFKGRIFGCDTCQRICPYNKDAAFSAIEGFRPKDFMDKINLQELINIDKKTFKEKYSGTSCGWRGKNILQRNALINAMILNKGMELKEINSPYVRNYYNRLFELFKP